MPVASFGINNKRWEERVQYALEKIGMKSFIIVLYF